VCEAAWLGKPVLVVPVQNHAEQMLNALDVVEAGLGIFDTQFRLDRVAELPERLDNTPFREWTRRSDEVLERALGRALMAGS
jgi:UDP-N-acetylglucosamine:LPS N-acetylglucosamine transferase